MFACLIAGQLPNTEFVRVTETQFICNVTVVTGTHHIVVFTTEPFPDGYGGAIYFNWPNPEPVWQYLGYITNEKPSAIFKVSKGSTAPSLAVFGGVSTNSQLPQLGVMVTPLTELAQMTAVSENKSLSVASNVQFVQNMLENLYNYLTSFSVTQSEMTPCTDSWTPEPPKKSPKPKSWGKCP
eukprot:sb/3471596/